jgi:hypothetical protein
MKDNFTAAGILAIISTATIYLGIAAYVDNKLCPHRIEEPSQESPVK